MPDEMQPVAPRLIKTHAHSWQRIRSAKLLGPHRVQGFGLQDPVALPFAPIQKRLREAAHIERRLRHTASRTWTENLKSDGCLFCIVPVTVGVKRRKLFCTLLCIARIFLPP